ncbi:MAG: hypothetical protein PHI22_02055 [Bacilli bacterium]|nr:hypothetical protein [Bacilli bacterium]
MEKGKDDLFNVYKKTSDSLRVAKDDLRYYRHKLNKCVPGPNYEEEYEDLTLKIVKTEEYIEQMKAFIEILESEIEEHIAKDNDIRYKVFKGSYIDNKSLSELSNELGYSYTDIKEINSKLLK